MKTIWLYGPSGAGKTTIGKEIQARLKTSGRNAVLIDGDQLRKTICTDLGFSYHDRQQQAIRAAYLAKAVMEGGSWTIVCLITPFREFREAVSKVLEGQIDLVYLSCSQKERVRRDPKGLYAKAIAGELSTKLTGYDGSFDAPNCSSALVVHTDKNNTPKEVAKDILDSVVGGAFDEGAGI